MKRFGQKLQGCKKKVAIICSISDITKSTIVLTTSVTIG
jgi:hypothetical protein